ncbi:MAG: homoaconitase [Acidobacteria bacterium]|nr:MAG: homoaconitase [Acidobacteriota bacterium]
MGHTVVEKIAAAHRVDSDAVPAAGEFVAIRPRHVMTHDNTAAVLIKFRALGARRIHDPRQPVFTLDHNIQDTSEKNLAKYREIEQFAAEQGVDHYPAGAGIGHQIMVERGYVQPGAFVVASDSHSNMYGALGALGTPVVRTDAAGIWATGEFWWQVPRTVQVVLDGRLREGVTGKDVIITLCGLYPDEVLNAVVEFAGPGVATLDVDARLTIANMSTEWGALAAWFPVDERTLAWLADRADRLSAEGVDRITAEDLERWRTEPPAPDPDARYAGRIRLDLARVSPHVAGPDTVQVTAPLARLERERIAVDKAYLVSCVNSRLSDLEAAARVLAGRRVADGVEFYVAAASAEVQREAERRGVWGTLLEAGARPLPPGCGPCIGLGAGLLEPGEVGISATNRNFKGRMGSREARCYLASPAVVAASAAAGHIAAPEPCDDTVPERAWEPIAQEAPDAGAQAVEIVDGFPETIRGRLVWLPQDNLNTDGIYGKDYTYREDMTPEQMAQVAMENYDPRFAELVRPGDVLVAGRNFGTGSSREQAATALKFKGIPLVIAASFSQTYLRNALNNGFLCIENAALPARLAELFGERAAAGEKTIVLDDEVVVDFRRGRITWRGEEFAFAPLGPVPQALIVAGGLEPQIRARLGLG